MASKAQVRAVLRYDKHNTVQYHIKLNKNTDADLIELLNSLPNKQGTIKALLRGLTAEQINAIIKEG